MENLRIPAKLSRNLYLFVIVFLEGDRYPQCRYGLIPADRHAPSTWLKSISTHEPNQSLLLPHPVKEPFSVLLPDTIIKTRGVTLRSIAWGVLPAFHNVHPIYNPNL